MGPVPVKKVRKPFENLASCMNIFKEPKSFYTAPKVRKPFENLAACMNIFKEPKSFYTPQKVADLDLVPLAWTSS